MDLTKEAVLQAKSPEEILAAAADELFDACDLSEDDDLDPDNHVEVIKRAYASSDCDDFAWMLHRMTGWQVVRATWQIPDWGFGHHTLVRSPEGRLLDVCGWTDEEALRKRYLGRKKTEMAFADAEPSPTGSFDEIEDDGTECQMTLIAGVIRNLPHAPYSTPEFRELTGRPLEGVDLPLPGEGPAPGPNL